MKKLLLLLLISSSAYSQTIQDFTDSKRFMDNNLIRKRIIEQQDSIIAYRDSALMDADIKLNQSQSIVMIQKSVLSQQAKNIVDLDAKYLREKKRKKTWRKVGVFAIVEHLVIGCAIYLTYYGK